MSLVSNLRLPACESNNNQASSTDDLIFPSIIYQDTLCPTLIVEFETGTHCLVNTAL